MIAPLLAWVIAAGPTPGPLVVVGGGAMPPAIAARALELAGGPAAKILIVPQASSDPTSGTASAKAWADRGAKAVTILDVADPAAARKAIAAADLIWMPGGDQVLLMAALQKADLVGAIRDRHRQGATVGGTSAGAAVQSGVMITGEAPLDAIRRGATVTVDGLDLWPGVIVDQHFVRRQRFQRLLAAVLDRPRLVGVGIDEGTAAVVTGTKFTVIGKGQVVVVDARKATVAAGKKDDPAAATGVRLHVLTPGMSFDLARE
jgi:cyanophycinase